jgi:hypothetical protein
VVIAPSTRRLTGGLFDYADLGAVELKGLAEPVVASRVLRDSAALSRFEALRATRTPLVGRDEELALLQRRWQQAKTGEGPGGGAYWRTRHRQIAPRAGDAGAAGRRAAHKAALFLLAASSGERAPSLHHPPRARRGLRPRGHAESAAGQARSAARPLERLRRRDRVHCGAVVAAGR